jgi:hypothetical protein
MVPTDPAYSNATLRDSSRPFHRLREFTWRILRCGHRVELR